MNVTSATTAKTDSQESLKDLMKHVSTPEAAINCLVSRPFVAEIDGMIALLLIGNIERNDPSNGTVT